MKRVSWFVIVRSAIVLALLTCALSSLAQDAGKPEASSLATTSDSGGSDSVRELQQQVRELQAAVAGMRADWQQARAETAEVRRQLDQMRNQSPLQDVVLRSAPMAPADSASYLREGNQQQATDAEAESGSGTQDKPEVSSKNPSTKLEEEYQLLSGKVDDQYQTKVESASKYRLRLSGIVLMNLVSNFGVVDSIDLPTIAYARPAGYTNGSFGATLRQSEIGLEAFGPNVAGAKTRADLQLDLAGGFSNVPNGINSGLMRLRTGTIRMDWANTSLIAGQDTIFFSPTSPTSFASLAIPALSYAGNLWSWVPQVRIEHRLALSERSGLLFQAGILDPVAGEVPASIPGTAQGNGYYRLPGPGEASRQPAFGTRVAWTDTVFGQPLRIGVGGFYSRQDYGFDRIVQGWAGMADIDLPLSRQFSLSGKFYRGEGVGGLYGAGGRSALFSGDVRLANTEVRGLNSVGGWAQLKYRPEPKLEFNAALGMDNPFASDLKYFPYTQSYGNPNLARNRGSLFNVIYRPRSDLLFSAEYRYLTTFSTDGSGNSAGQLNLAVGVLF